MNQNGVSPLFIIISVLILGFGSAYFLVGMTKHRSEGDFVQTDSPNGISETQDTAVLNIKPKPTVIAQPSIPQSPLPSARIEISNKKQYTSTTYNYSIEYPENWNLSRVKDAEGVPQVIIKPINGSPTTSLYISVNSPYSTSGMVCANQPCMPSSDLKGVSNGQAFYADVVKVNKEYRFMFELPNKKVSVQGYSEPISLNIYGSYENEDEKEVILSILASLHY